MKLGSISRAGFKRSLINFERCTETYEKSMPKYSPSIAKNQMVRCLRAIIDPLPTYEEISKLWDYFQCECAYCGSPLSRSDRNGQLDHVEPQSKGGSNSIYNCVLSCGTCNGDHKRNMDWETFLVQSVLEIELQKTRHLRIQDWLDMRVHKNLYSAEVQGKIEAIQIAATKNFDSYVQMMRELRQQQTHSD
jgi:hypothetical protein